MANTGLRPHEANILEFRDMEIVEVERTGETIRLISVRGKRGVGYCKSMAKAEAQEPKQARRLRQMAGGLIPPFGSGRRRQEASGTARAE